MPLNAPLSLEEIAIAAKEYARKYVKKGSTQLENNELSEISQLVLEAGVEDLRGEINAVLSASRDENKYEALISTIKKYSLGNCGEMAWLALHYVLTQHPDIFAQIYKVSNGDHVVLVIKKGAETFISDPWSNKVYPFFEWKNQLKNYVYNRIALSKEALEFQENKLKELEDNGLYVKDRNDWQLALIDRKKNEIVGKTYFFKFRNINHACLLDSNQALIPLQDADILSLYKKGTAYRRAKIKDVLDLLELFKDIFPFQIYNLKQLLSQQFLLQDDCLQAPLTYSQLESHKSMIKRGLADLKDIEHSLHCAELIQKQTHLRSKFYFLLKQSSHFEFLKKITLAEKFYPLPEQLNKVNDAIDCLDQLLEGRPANCASNKLIKNRKLSESISGFDDTKLFNAYTYICEHFIKGYRAIKNFSIELDYYCKQFNEILPISKDYSSKGKEEINHLISDLQKVISKYLKLPTPMGGSVLQLRLDEAKITLVHFSSLTFHTSLILSICKLTKQLKSFEKGAPIPPPRKMSGETNRTKVSENNLSTLFRSVPVDVQTSCLPAPLFTDRIYLKP